MEVFNVDGITEMTSYRKINNAKKCTRAPIVITDVNLA